jgi:DNA-binding transcriptional ArsR family regulator
MRQPSGGGAPSPQLLDELSQFFRLLSEPARLQLLCQLKHQGPMDVASLIAATGFSQSHISRQLAQLQRSGLVRSVREGTRLSYELADQLVDELCNLVQDHLKQRLEQQLRLLRPV